MTYIGAAVKRRYNANNSSESTASTSTTSSKSSLRFGTSQESQSTSRTSASEHDNSPVFAEPYPLLAKPVLSTSVPRRPAITVPSVTDAIDLTTPSLSSDHDEVSNEDETSQEDKLPHTPPTHTMDLPESPQSTASSPLKGVPAFAPPKTADFYIEPIRDTTSRRPRYLTPPPRVRDQTPSPSYSPILVAFPKRLPSSPLPAASPRRPKPPGRIPGKALRPSRTQTRNSGNLDDLDNDPLSLSSKSVDVEASNGIRSRPVIRPLNVRDKLTRSRSASRVNTASDRSETRHFTRDKNVSQNPRTDTNEASTSRRYAGEASNSRGDRSDFRNSKRDTLHDELRRANASLPLSLEPQPDLFESEVYLGVGTKSKHRGFLAGGGAGGVPVFMGEGYVDGVEVEWEGEVRVIPGLEVEHEGQKQITEHEVQLRQPAQRTVGKKGSGIPRRQRAQ
ncbi:hypothetical protein NEOLEDRAFT_489548 [Neolentinus lepideus HHB14362 ss-1]|uniref:Uncharacterized protein n=1 Tax=Neolentinus lepideus HHB14362 ss-1 TaxID=1314782 RepID=A0A165VNZ2_9AGAM|nr:hypothetical protein NEOLEDRAFT_489548 [Neolentinus lepideus HHB14362 ss-1]